MTSKSISNKTQLHNNPKNRQIRATNPRTRTNSKMKMMKKTNWIMNSEMSFKRMNRNTRQNGTKQERKKGSGKERMESRLKERTKRLRTKR